MKNDPEMCCICGMMDGMSDTELNLMRLTWVQKDKQTRIIIPNERDVHDRFVCEQCIRDIKALPFSEIKRGVIDYKKETKS